MYSPTINVGESSITIRGRDVALDGDGITSVSSSSRRPVEISRVGTNQTEYYLGSGTWETTDSLTIDALIRDAGAVPAMSIPSPISYPLGPLYFDNSIGQLDASLFGITTPSTGLSIVAPSKQVHTTLPSNSGPYAADMNVNPLALLTIQSRDICSAPTSPYATWPRVTEPYDVHSFAYDGYKFYDIASNTTSSLGTKLLCNEADIATSQSVGYYFDVGQSLGFAASAHVKVHGEKAIIDVGDCSERFSLSDSLGYGADGTISAASSILSHADVHAQGGLYGFGGAVIGRGRQRHQDGYLFIETEGTAQAGPENTCATSALWTDSYGLNFWNRHPSRLGTGIVRNDFNFWNDNVFTDRSVLSNVSIETTGSVFAAGNIATSGTVTANTSLQTSGSLSVDGQAQIAQRLAVNGGLPTVSAAVNVAAQTYAGKFHWVSEDSANKYMIGGATTTSGTLGTNYTWLYNQSSTARLNSYFPWNIMYRGTTHLSNSTAGLWTALGGYATPRSVTAGVSLQTTGSLSVDGNAQIGGTANYVKIGANGHLTMTGNATQWDDLRIAPALRTVVATQPTFSQFKTNGAGSSGVYLWFFPHNSEKEMFFTAQMPHGWNEASTVYPHVHWIPNTNGAANQEVTWGLEYTWQSIGGVYGNTTISTGTTTLQNETLVASKQYLTNIPEGGAGISGAGQTVSSVIVGRLYRDVGDARDDYADTAGIVEFDIHYEMDSLGGNTAESKN